MTYNEFKEMLDSRISSGDEVYKNLLSTILRSPERYCGLFRLSNASSKLMQNITQSREIKFGDFLEEMVTHYLCENNFVNLEKNLGADIEGDILFVDQYFEKDGVIYFAEQKVRDDHDSTKKRGQFLNFLKKYNHIKRINPDREIIGSMWFIDDGLRKNRNYYQQEIDNMDFGNDSINLYYGDGFFNSLNLNSQWEEILSHLEKLRLESVDDIIEIPNFDTSEIIYEAMLELPNNLWNRLNSNNEVYELLRKELFPTMYNINKAKQNR